MVSAVSVTVTGRVGAAGVPGVIRYSALAVASAGIAWPVHLSDPSGQ